MKIPLIYQIDPVWYITILFILMLVSLYTGSRVSKKRRNDIGDDNRSGVLVAGMFSLSAFILVFTFGMSVNRYEERRHVIVTEANNIGTAVLRADLYPDSVRNLFRAEFKKYVEARIAFFEAGKDIDKIMQTLKMSEESSSKLWQIAAGQSRIPSNLVASNQMIPALNDMIDVVMTRNIGLLSKVPPSILIMLFLLSITSSFFAGIVLRHIDWLIATGFCFLTAMVIYITLDLDQPRRGFIQLDTSQKAMYDLRKMFEQ
ncbi:MAG: hypothetical protein J7497_05615 [Chitinophagaceae bacterium]|nr:hypothetical protein [Chitinophagaceae bacterium]